jgi:hypothetical protein
MQEALQLVSLEQAKKLKELGFNWEVDFYADVHRNFYSAPTIALALKWFRDVKGCRYTIYSDTTDIDNNSTEGIFYMYKTEGLMLDIEYETYEQCESALLDALLEYCEEEAK